MTKTRCMACAGSGQIMGGGMMMSDCDKCDGAGKIEAVDQTLLNKQSSQHQEAIEKIKALDSSMTQEKAESLFAEAYHALDKTVLAPSPVESLVKYKRGKRKATTE